MKRSVTLHSQCTLDIKHGLKRVTVGRVNKGTMYESDTNAVFATLIYDLQKNKIRHLTVNLGQQFVFVCNSTATTDNM